MSLTCEICEATDDTSGQIVDERLLINYHPVVLCTECCRALVQRMSTSTEFINYQASLDYTESLRRRKFESMNEHYVSANEFYCNVLKQAGRLMMRIMHDMKGEQES